MVGIVVMEDGVVGGGYLVDQWLVCDFGFGYEVGGVLVVQQFDVDL